MDQDLFDGNQPSILQPSTPSDYQFDIIKLVQERISDVNLLLGPLDAAPSAMHGSVRGCFMPKKNPMIASVIYGIDNDLGKYQILFSGKPRLIFFVLCRQIGVSFISRFVPRN